MLTRRGIPLKHRWPVGFVREFNPPCRFASGSGTNIVIEQFCVFLRLGEARHNDPWEFQ